MSATLAATPLLTYFAPFGFLPDFSAPPEIRTTSPTRIYVACLAAYNNGCLHGRWIDATLGESHIWAQTRAMLAASPIEEAEEWAIHDYEGFEGASVSEWASFESVAAMAEFIAEHEELGGPYSRIMAVILRTPQRRLRITTGNMRALKIMRGKP